MFPEDMGLRRCPTCGRVMIRRTMWKGTRQTFEDLCPSCDWHKLQNPWTYPVTVRDGHMEVTLEDALERMRAEGAINEDAYLELTAIAAKLREDASDGRDDASSKAIVMPDGRMARWFVRGDPSAVPDAYRLPSRDGMRPREDGGAEHEQSVRWRTVATSVVREPGGPTGCRWVADVSVLNRNAAWHEDSSTRLVGVVLDCEADPGDEVAIRTCLELLGEALAKGGAHG